MSVKVATLMCLATVLAVLSVTEVVTSSVRPGRPGQPSAANAEPCKPPSGGSASVGLKGYPRYRARDSLIGKRIPCSYDDKVCFRFNLLFDPVTDRCQPLGGGHRHGCDLGPNKTEFEQGSGRFMAICKEYKDPCPGYRMAYDNRCYRKEVVHDVICGCGVSLTRHMLGGVECRSTALIPKDVEQPYEDKQCRIPDLRFPDTERSVFYKNPLVRFQGFDGDRTGISFRNKSPILECTQVQGRCFSNGRVSVAGHDGCFELLSRGPCPEDHVVAMDALAVLESQADAVCVHVRGNCPPGYRLMAFDGECHENRAIQISAPVEIVKNQYGQNVLIPIGFSVSFHPNKTSSGDCVINVWGVGPGGSDMALPNPPCGANNRDLCSLFEVEHEAPPPEED